MTDFSSLLTDGSVVNFMLLFFRLGSLFVFMPFFSSPTILISIKASLAFLFTILFYPIISPIGFELTIGNVLFAIFTEVLFGFSAGIILSIVFAMVLYAGEQISFVMGFSMATTMDPQTQTSSPIISQFMNLFAILLFLSFDGHHLLILYLSSSLDSLSLGGYVFEQKYFDYAMDSMSSLFVIGFSIAFPIIALSLLSDIIFGMIMKTVPSFNLLVIGFPVKIAVSITVFIAILSSVVVVFKNTFLDFFNSLSALF